MNRLELAKLAIGAFVNYPIVSDPIKKLMAQVDGMCPGETLQLLNILVHNYVLPSERYLEIGTWKGRTVIGALLNNDREATVIDPLTFDDSNVVFYRNIREAGVDTRISFFQKPWEHVIQTYPQSQVFSLFFFDGDHGDRSTFNAWEAWLSFCTDECILIADDLDMGPVKKDVDDFAAKYKDNIVFRYDTQFFMGQSIIGFRK